MPSGIIMQSGSVGATQEAIEAVLEKHGYEADKPAVEEAKPAEEPKREAFASDEEFETAHETWTETQEAAAAELEEQEEEQAAKPAPKTRLTRRQRAIDKATRQLQDEVRKLRDELKAARGGVKEPPAAPKLVEPKQEDFASGKEYEDALFDYRYKLRRAKEQAEAAQKAQNEQLQTNFENYQAQVAEYRETVDDWDEVLAGNKTPIHESVYLAIHELENGAAVTYYLGKHPDFTQKLADMTPLSAAMEVGRLADRLKTGAPGPGAAGSGARSKPKPKLPEPVKPVSTAATSSTLTSREAAVKRDFRAFKAAQRRGV